MTLDMTIMLPRIHILLLITIFFSLFVSPSSQAVSETVYESPDLEVGLKPRTPEQIAAFYEARGFNKPMIEMLKQQCFITVWVHNKSKRVIWLDLSKWEFTNSTGKVIRKDRQYWKDTWKTMKIPLAHQSTFRWTLIPEMLDFQPDEREGGNIILPRDNRSLMIQAKFPTHADKSGVAITVSFDNIRCAEDP